MGAQLKSPPRGWWRPLTLALLLVLLPLLAPTLLRALVGPDLAPDTFILPTTAAPPLPVDSWPQQLRPSWRRRTAQSLLDKWAAVPGKHPLCEPESLRREIVSLPRAPPDDAGPLTLAGLTVFVRHPLPIRNALTANVSKMLEKMRTTWPSQEAHFLIPFAADHVFLFSRGTGIDCELLGAFLDMGWARVAPAPAMRCSGAGGGTGAADASGIYRSRLGTRIIVRGRDFSLPRYLEANLGVLQNEEWLNCGKRRDLSYVLSLSAYAHHVLEEPALDAYGAYMKLDLDTMFRSTPPGDPRELLKSCALAYFKLYPDESCNTGAHDALRLFSETTGLPIASRGAPWFETGTWFYGLLYMVRTSLVLAPANIVLRTWLYECVEHSYFRYRWLEHAVLPLYLGMWENVPAGVREEGGRVVMDSAPNVCDFSTWFEFDDKSSIVQSEWYSSMADFTVGK